ncbi:UPF0280 family protein [Methanomethylophilus alvi]|uniref:UPF0280 family protein n=1 Tax=Methanomethylophilus alvi TaxID=1291540 RepID=UPI0037DDC5AE
MRVRRRIVVGETCLDVCTEESFADEVPDLISEARGMIEEKIGRCPGFGTSLVPVEASASDPPLVRRMCKAGADAGVGPMASVAGAVALYVVEGLVADGCTYAVADNGGDIALFSEEEVIIGLYTGKKDTSSFGFRIPCTDGVLGICSSSASIGPSLSFGDSDIATVVSRDPVLADACATRLGNEIKGEGDLSRAAETVCVIPGVDGCLAVSGGAVCTCGDVPEIVFTGRRGSVWTSAPCPFPQGGCPDIARISPPYVRQGCTMCGEILPIFRNAYKGYQYRHL